MLTKDKSGAPDKASLSAEDPGWLGQSPWAQQDSYAQVPAGWPHHLTESSLKVRLVLPTSCLLLVNHHRKSVLGFGGTYSLPSQKAKVASEFFASPFYTEPLWSESTGGERLDSLFWVLVSVMLYFLFLVEDKEREGLSRTAAIPPSPALGERVEKQHVHTSSIRAEIKAWVSSC